ncbi:HlyD family type I secretion periplasmic adaptor subunit [Azospirillum sp. SYSU D00513]|uniref:HlyD family type I secretion periplasmic adaptor subunit n=1 Tax=Azospirillum sp. SYSU D00513 TaxID=2812561 RepID=UPI001A95F31E|nr:HlyD family type I secretion periplasmic adaptor subunit [Azospirillum sp. SYSU D00513]
MAQLVPLSRRASTSGIPLDEIRKPPRIRHLALLGTAVTVLWFGLFGGWAAVARLDSAAMAAGALTSESHRKTIQHLDGGIVRAIHVRDGDRVSTGQVLVELDDTRAGAEVALADTQFRFALARGDRLRAELADAADVTFNPVLLAAQGQPEVAAMIEGQRRQFLARRTAHHGQIDILNKRIDEFTSEIAALTAQEAAVAAQIGFIAEELKDARTLLAKGLMTRPRTLALEREAASLQGRRGELLAGLSKVRQSISAAELQKIDLDNARRKEITQEMEAVGKEQADAAERLVAARDVLGRTVVRAPQDGTVVGLSLFTKGGVIRTGEPLLDIVPEKDQLLADVRVNPADIDTVRPGLTARVQLVSYNSRVIPTVEGTVLTVSADGLKDERTGEFYYLARVKLSPADIAALPDVELQPGMPVHAMIRIGERTALDYLLTPLTQSLASAMREQ